MTSLQKDRWRDVAVAVAILPLALAISPILVVVYWWNCLTDCWEDHGARHRRNEWLEKEVHRTQEERKA